MLAALGLALLLQTAPAPTPEPTPKPAGVVPSFDITAAAIVAHDFSSGWKNPRISLGALALGPHWGPVYIGGTALFQGTDGTTSGGIAYITYCGQGYYKGWGRGLVVSVGQRVVSEKGDTDRGFWFGIGVGRQ